MGWRRSLLTICVVAASLWCVAAVYRIHGQEQSTAPGRPLLQAVHAPPMPGGLAAHAPRD